ncbi:hypothetical protein IQ06DRAFT_359485 [Phaeosphaeriaceae sp. SRC1lsM3a]|nr:hypothetical protein IQ06DRAFT_359485 [Stagonospora sp. SRC1lsM3a]
MLRLRPSELTVTPEDVEATFRRLAQRQALRGPKRGSSLPGRPVLHRGPQRFVRGAITTLGDVPLLRPQPQQAIFSSVDDEDLEDNGQQQAPSPRAVDNDLNTASPLQDQQTMSVPANTPSTSPLRALDLPFRIGHTHRDSQLQQHEERSHVDASASPLQRSSTPIMGDGSASADPVAPGQRSPHTPPASSPSPAGLRGGGRQRKRDTRRSSRESFSTPSPTRQRLRDNSDRGRLTPNVPTSNCPAERTPPTLYLEGYVTDPAKHPKGPEYWFRELVGVTPQTEPRRGSGRHVVPTRSLSSGNVTSHTLAVRRRASSNEDIFGECINDTGSLNQPQRGPEVLPRQFSSEASSSSTAFSIYQMPPESRNPSGHDSEGMEHSLSQYDGSTASRQANRGAYRSVRQSDLEGYRQAARNTLHDANTERQQSVSPLPVMPYTRSRRFQVDPQSSTGDMDAGAAAIQGLPSPLEPFSTHYQRLLESQNAQRGDQWDSTHSVSSQHDVVIRDSTSNARVRQVIDRLPHQYPAHRYPAIAPPVPSNHPTQTAGRSVQTTRASQRSSENAPVRPPAQSRGPSRNSQVQIHRAAFERLHNAVQVNNSSSPEVSQQGLSHLSLPHPPAPRHPSTRRRAHVSHALASRRRTPQLSSSPQLPLEQSLPQLNHVSTAAASPDFPAHMVPGPSINAREVGPRFAPHHAHRTARAIRSPPPFPLARLNEAPSTLRSSTLHAHSASRPPRRVPAQQLDQENSGAGEEALMRREEEAIRARHSQEVQDAVTMDETPPRVGRVERRMFS